MTAPVTIDPDAIYDENALCLALGLTAATLKFGRQTEGLRHTRKGQRNFYVGRWVISWLTACESGQVEPSAEMAVAS